MNRSYEILKYIKEKKEYISGREIGEFFGISRAAVHKHIDSLKKEGYIIKSVSNKGYKLVEAPDIINPLEIKSGLDTRLIGSEVLCYKTLTSTNDKLKELGEEGHPSGTVVITEEQTRGKGRRGRSWKLSPKDAIAMSVLLRPSFSPEYAANLTLIMGMAVNNTLRKLCNTDTYIKWPNDIVINGKKLCGILLEMVTEEKEVKYIVCGVGINVSNTDFPDEIKNTATSIYLETGKKYSRKDIIRSILSEFDRYYSLYENKDALPELISEYKKSCINIGREVIAIYDNRQIKGIAADVNLNGELIIKNENNNEIILRSGEVSVRGVYDKNDS